jgi:hypothetical protein
MAGRGPSRHPTPEGGDRAGGDPEHLEESAHGRQRRRGCGRRQRLGMKTAGGPEYLTLDP